MHTKKDAGAYGPRFFLPVYIRRKHNHMEKLLSRLLRRIRRELCIGVFLVLAIGVHGQQERIDLNKDRGLNPAAHKKMMIRDLPEIAGSIVKAKAKYAQAYAYLSWKEKWTDADGKFLRLSVASAEGLEAVWDGHALGIDQPCISRNAISGYGEYWVNYPIPKHMGRWEGAGPHLGWYPSHSALTFHVWKEEWLGSDPHEMCSMLSTGYKIEGNAGWLHGGYIGEIGFVGNNSGWYDPSYTESGLVLWDEAEASTIGNIWSVDHNGYGVKVIRGTPCTFTGVTSVFTNALGGLGLFDGELGTFSLGTVSGDDNPALVVMDSKYGRGAGGMVSFRLQKSESGKRVPNKGQIILWQKSPCVGAINIDMAQSDQNGNFSDAPFVMQSRAWGQTLFVGGFVGWNMRTLVHDVTNKVRWECPSYAPRVFVWSSANGGSISDLVTLTHMPKSPVNASDRLGQVPNNGTFDYMNGLPAYSVKGGAIIAPTCTWVPGVETCEPCSAGVQTCRTPYVASNAGCTPTGAKPGDGMAVKTCSVPAPTIGITSSPAKMEGSDGNPPVLRPLGAAVDGNTSTYWLSGTGMTVGQYVILDLGTARSVKSVTFPIPPGYLNSYPRRFDVATATGTQFTNRKTGVVGGAVSTATWGAVNARYIRITVRDGNPNWWGTTEFRIE